MDDATRTKTYHGPSGEVVTAYDEAGRQFLESYARHAAGGIENSAAGMQMLAQIVHAAGGEVRVAFRGLGTFRRLSITVSEDAANNDLVFKTKEI